MGRLALSVFVSAILVCPLSGCVETDGPSVYISGHVRPDDECVLTPDAPVLLTGTFNVERGNEYVMFPVMNNQLVNRGSDAPLMADPNVVQIEGSEVELQDGGGNPLSLPGLPNPFTVLGGVSVPSTETPGTAGQSVAGIVVIPNAYRIALFDLLGGAGGDPLSQQTIVVSVLPFGRTLGGVDIEVDPFSYVVRLCRGNCLVDPSPDAADNVCCTPFQDELCAGTFM